MEKKKITYTVFRIGIMACFMVTFSWIPIQDLEAGDTEKEGTRIEDLLIDQNAQKYFDSLEIVAFAPGSGWLKLKTHDGIAPLISFASVNKKDIQKFNNFSKSIGEPIRISIASDNVLKISAEDKDAAPGQYVQTGHVDENYKVKLFRFPKPQNTLVLHKDPKGKIFIVKAKDKTDQFGVVSLNK